MPTGGQLSSGSGLQLQPTTPGLADKGNAHITGVLISDHSSQFLQLPTTLGGPGVVTPGQSALAIGTQTFVQGGGGGAWPNLVKNFSIWIGQGVTVRQNPNGNMDGGEVVIGSTASVFGGEGVTIGYGASNGNFNSYPISEAYSVVIGYNALSWCQSYLVDDVVIGHGAAAGNAAQTVHGTVAIGHSAISNNQNGQNIVICSDGLINPGHGNILLCTSASAPNETLNNCIRIGDSTHTNVFLGPFNFTDGNFAVNFRASLTVTLTNTIVQTSIIGSGIGSQASAIGANVGKMYRIRAFGDIQTNGAGQTLALQLKVWGAQASYGLAFNRSGGSAISLPSVATPTLWELEAEIILMNVGSGGPPPAGRMISSAYFALNQDPSPEIRYNSGVQGQTPCDTLTASNIDLLAQWGAASPNNILNCYSFVIESIGLP